MAGELEDIDRGMCCVQKSEGRWFFGLDDHRALTPKTPRDVVKGDHRDDEGCLVAQAHSSESTSQRLAREAPQRPHAHTQIKLCGPIIVAFNIYFFLVHETGC